MERDTVLSRQAQGSLGSHVNRVPTNILASSIHVVSQPKLSVQFVFHSIKIKNNFRGKLILTSQNQMCQHFLVLALKRLQTVNRILASFILVVSQPKLSVWFVLPVSNAKTISIGSLALKRCQQGIPTNILASFILVLPTRPPRFPDSYDFEAF